MSTYEYRTQELRHHPGLPGALMEDQLNELAEDGWRLVQVLEKRWPLAIMEREKRVEGVVRS
jgi:DNA-binding HxlR family transcriptional regulator